MAEPELPVAKEISEPLIVVAESVSSEIQHRREIYVRNTREISTMVTISSCIVILYIIYICAHIF